MKKAIILSFILMLLLSSCQKIDEDPRLKVYTTFYAMFDLTKKIGQDKINVVNLVPSGIEVHDYEIGTKDMIALERADVLIYNGLNLEHWIEDVVSSLTNNSLLLVNTTENIDQIEGDPHAWLSINNAKLQMLAIKNALVTIDVVNKDFYEANYLEYANKFDELHNRYLTTIATFSKKDIVVAHEAYGYMCHEYGLNQIGVEGVFSETEPDPKKMAEIINFIEENNVSIVFYESLGSADVASVIANEVGISVDVLNPFEGLTKVEINNNEDYLSIMEKNLIALERALK